MNLCHLLGFYLSTLFRLPFFLCRKRPSYGVILLVLNIICIFFFFNSYVWDLHHRDLHHLWMAIQHLGMEIQNLGMAIQHLGMEIQNLGIAIQHLVLLRKIRKEINYFQVGKNADYSLT